MRQVWFQNKRSKERRLKQLTSMGLRPYFGASRKLRGFPVSPGLDDGSGVGVGVGGFNPYFDPKYAAEFSYGGGPGPHPGHPFNLHPGHPGHPGLGPHPHPNGVPFGDFFGPPPPPPQGGAQPNGPGAPSGGPQGPQGNAPFGATGGKLCQDSVKCKNYYRRGAEYSVNAVVSTKIRVNLALHLAYEYVNSGPRANNLLKKKAARQWTVRR